jgi:hypothetical protein
VYSKNINTTVGFIVDTALDSLLEENKVEKINNDKLKQLQILFPEKSIEQLMMFLKT